VYADLVGATGARPQLEETAPAAREAPRDTPERCRRAAAARADAHALAVALVASDRQVDLAALRPGHAAHDGQVDALDAVLAELVREVAMREVTLRDDEHAGGSAVEAVHDARPQHVADAGQVVAVVQQRVDERPAAVSGRRVHDDPRGLVEHDQVLVLVEHGERDGFRRGARGLGIRRDRLDEIARAHAQAGGHLALVDAHASLFDPAPCLRARAVGERRQRQVEARPRLGFTDEEVHAGSLAQRRAKRAAC
jgi:hypothetical protein